MTFRPGEARRAILIKEKEEAAALEKEVNERRAGIAGVRRGNVVRLDISSVQHYSQSSKSFRQSNVLTVADIM